ncbi:hypothetical protein GP486_000530 [Trichoglossum hirsutum]|uniref:Uncharacterized protein n=1 Tax=Trichoglossum hirsutum TaxID=265104 RepID=A0A9P8LHL6_9PEZI|nr:hypothetical protein GP486_000530 [Trichoglossum hirsutum]
MHGKPQMSDEQYEKEMKIVEIYIEATKEVCLGNYVRDLYETLQANNPSVRAFIKQWEQKVIYFASVYDALFITISIASIELILRWNEITGVYDVNSTGQIFPTVVGTGGVITVIWSGICSDLLKRPGKASHEILSLVPESYRGPFDPDPGFTANRAILDMLFYPNHYGIHDECPGQYDGARDKYYKPEIITNIPPRRQSADSVHVPGFHDSLVRNVTSEGKVQLTWKSVKERGLNPESQAMVDILSSE